MNIGDSMRGVKSDQAELKQEATPSVEHGLSFPLTSEQAAVTAYPPACLVLHVNETETPPVVTVGEVESVSFDVASKELLYRVTPKGLAARHAIVTRETQLLFAPLCPVEATINGMTESTTKPAIVLTSYQPRPASEPLYSLQEVDSGSLLHGLPKSCIKYRRPASSEEEQNSSDRPQQAQEPIAAEVMSSSHVEPSADAQKSESPPSMHVVNRVGRRPSVPGNGIKLPARRTISCAETENSPSADGMEQQQSKRARVDDTNNEPKAATHIFDPSSADDNTEGVETDNMETLSQDESLGNMSPANIDHSYYGPPAKQERSMARTNSTSDYPRGQGRGEGTETQFETEFNIPRNVFGVDEIKEFFRANTDKLMRKTHCDIRLRTRSHDSHARHYDPMYVEVKGGERSVEAALCTLEESLLELVTYDERCRALYYMAFVNNHRHWTKRGDCDIVYQYVYGRKDEMKHMVYKRLPKGFRDAVGLIVGTKGSTLKQMRRETKCYIEINSGTRSPHYVIYGEDVDAVDRCVQRLETHIQKAIKIKMDEKYRGHS